MSDLLEQLEQRAIPSGRPVYMGDEETKPKRPHRRTRPLPNGADALAAMEVRLAALESQAPAPPQLHTIPQQPEARPEAKPATPDSLTPFQAAMAAKARPMPRDYVRNDPGFNYPMAWYARPDGEIVQLQGDPNNRAMYTDLGFHLLSREEAEQWETVERARVVAHQKEKASIITAIRTYAMRTPGYVLEYDQPNTDEAFSDMSVERLREVVAEIEAEKGSRIRIPKPKPEPKTSTSDARSSGIEAGAVDGRLQGLLDGSRQPRRANGRTIEPKPGQPLNFVP